MALNHYLINNSVVMIGSCSVVDPLTRDETPTEPTTVTFIRQLEDGTITTYTTGDPEVTNLGVGIDACTVTIDTAGVEKWAYLAQGVCDARAEDQFEVDPSIIT